LKFERYESFGIRLNDFQKVINGPDEIGYSVANHHITTQMGYG
jgi:hypothetical protein